MIKYIILFSIILLMSGYAFVRYNSDTYGTFTYMRFWDQEIYNASVETADGNKVNLGRSISKAPEVDEIIDSAVPLFIP